MSVSTVFLTMTVQEWKHFSKSAGNMKVHGIYGTLHKSTTDAKT